jgi:uncharacterized protein YbjT (DUF2867 family)
MSARHVAFVAGATGYTGREVVRELRARGLETIAHVRPDSPVLQRWRSEFEALGARIDTTTWEETAMKATFVALQPTLVFALIGTTRARAARSAASPAARSAVPESYETVDYALTSLLMRAVVAGAPGARFVLLSAAGTREGTTNAYLAVRARLERELVASGLAFTIARPAFVSGSDRAESRPLERAGAIVGDAALALLGALGARRFQRRWSSITGRTLAHGLVRAALEPAAAGRTLTTEDLRSSQSDDASAPRTK